MKTLSFAAAGLVLVAPLLVMASEAVVDRYATGPSAGIPSQPTVFPGGPGSFEAGGGYTQMVIVPPEALLPQAPEPAPKPTPVPEESAGDTAMRMLYQGKTPPSSVPPATAEPQTAQLPSLRANLQASGPVIKVERRFFDPEEVDRDVRYIGPDGRRLGVFEVRKGSLRENLKRLSNEVSWPQPDVSGLPVCADWQIPNDYVLMAADIADAVDLLLTGFPLFADIHLPNRMIKVTMDSRKTVECA